LSIRGSKNPEEQVKKAEFRGLDRLRCPDCGALLRKDGDTWVCDHCGYWDYDWDEICHECPEYGTEHCPCELWLETNPGSLRSVALKETSLSYYFSFFTRH